MARLARLARLAMLGKVAWLAKLARLARLSRLDRWDKLEEPDQTGFCGLVSHGLSVAGCDRQNFSEKGYMRRFQGKDGQVEWIAEDSPIVCFESAPDDEHGAHAALLTYSDETGAFPPNTMVRL